MGTIYEKGGMEMAIGNAFQKGSWVYIYDKKGRRIGTVPAGIGPKDGLMGYTSSTVNVQAGSWICTYDVSGRRLRVTPAR
jgi:hypothetical protein